MNPFGPMRVKTGKTAASTSTADGFDGLVKPSGLKDWAYETIKKLILDLAFSAGEQLDVKALSEKMRISRTPLREALLRLESEGLVRAEPRVGFFVSGVTKQDLRELFELREITEGYAAEKAARRLTDSDFDHLEELQRSSEEAVGVGDLERFTEVEIGIHSLILNSSQNRRLLQMIESIKDLTYCERMMAVRTQEEAKKSLILANVSESVREHRRIVDALRQKDCALAGRAMVDHIRAVKTRLLEFLGLPEQEPTD